MPLFYFKLLTFKLSTYNLTKVAIVEGATG
jgi:hypothetical protein